MFNPVSAIQELIHCQNLSIAFGNDRRYTFEKVKTLAKYVFENHFEISQIESSLRLQLTSWIIQSGDAIDGLFQVTILRTSLIEQLTPEDFKKALDENNEVLIQQILEKHWNSKDLETLLIYASFFKHEHSILKLLEFYPDGIQILILTQNIESVRVFFNKNHQPAKSFLSLSALTGNVELFDTVYSLCSSLNADDSLTTCAIASGNRLMVEKVQERFPGILFQIPPHVNWGLYFSLKNEHLGLYANYSIVDRLTTLLNYISAEIHYLSIYRTIAEMGHEEAILYLTRRSSAAYRTQLDGIQTLDTPYDPSSIISKLVSLKDLSVATGPERRGVISLVETLALDIFSNQFDLSLLDPVLRVQLTSWLIQSGHNRLLHTWFLKKELLKKIALPSDLILAIDKNYTRFSDYIHSEVTLDSDQELDVFIHAIKKGDLEYLIKYCIDKQEILQLLLFSYNTDLFRTYFDELYSNRDETWIENFVGFVGIVALSGQEELFDYVYERFAPIAWQALQELDTGFEPSHLLTAAIGSGNRSLIEKIQALLPHNRPFCEKMRWILIFSKRNQKLGFFEKFSILDSVTSIYEHTLQEYKPTLFIGDYERDCESLYYLVAQLDDRRAFEYLKERCPPEYIDQWSVPFIRPRTPPVEEPLNDEFIEEFNQLMNFSSQQTVETSTPSLRTFVQNGDVEQLENLLDSQPKLVEDLIDGSKDDLTPLQCAFYAENESIVRLMLKFLTKQEDLIPKLNAVAESIGPKMEMLYLDFVIEHHHHKAIKDRLIIKVLSQIEIYFPHIIKQPSLIKYILDTQYQAIQDAFDKRGGIEKLSEKDQRTLLPLFKPSEIRSYVNRLHKSTGQIKVFYNNSLVDIQVALIKSNNMDKIPDFLSSIPYDVLSCLAKDCTAILTPYIKWMDPLQLAVTIPLMPSIFLQDFLSKLSIQRKAELIKYLPLLEKKEILRKTPLIPPEIKDAQEKFQQIQQMLYQLQTKLLHLPDQLLIMNGVQKQVTGRETDEELLSLLTEQVGLVESMKKELEPILYKSDEITDEKLNTPPDEFLDEITADLMKDPIQLPGTKDNVDRSTITPENNFLILGDSIFNPFNLTYYDKSEYLPNEELRQRILDWKTNH